MPTVDQPVDMHASIDMEELKPAGAGRAEPQVPVGRFRKLEDECHEILSLGNFEHWSPDEEEARKAFEENDDVVAKLNEMGKLVVEIRNWVQAISRNGSSGHSQRDSMTSSSKGPQRQASDKDHQRRESHLRNAYSGRPSGVLRLTRLA